MGDAASVSARAQVRTPSGARGRRSAGDFALSDDSSSSSDVSCVRVASLVPTPLRAVVVRQVHLYVTPAAR